MTDANPLVDTLRAAATDRARAEWLEAIPLAFVTTDFQVIAAALDAARFEPGRAYLDALFAQQNARRLADGRYPITVAMTTEAARSAMWDAVRRKELPP